MARNYKEEYENYQGKPEQIKRRSFRNKARRALEKAGLVHKGDGKDVDHIKPLAKGGAPLDRSNLRPTSQHANRSFRRTRTARMK